jgi:hypothetical protein
VTTIQVHNFPPVRAGDVFEGLEHFAGMRIEVLTAPEHQDAVFCRIRLPDESRKRFANTLKYMLQLGERGLAMQLAAHINQETYGHRARAWFDECRDLGLLKQVTGTQQLSALSVQETQVEAPTGKEPKP